MLAFPTLVIAISSIHKSQVKLHHLPPSWNADEDGADYLRTVTAVMTSIVFNFFVV